MHSILTRLLLLSLCVFRNYFGFCWQLRMKPTDVWIAEWQVDGRSVRPHIDRQSDIRMDKLSGFWMNCLVDRPWRTNKYTKFSFVVHRHTSIYFLFLLPTDFPHFTIFLCVDSLKFRKRAKPTTKSYQNNEHQLRSQQKINGKNRK